MKRLLTILLLSAGLMAAHAQKWGKGTVAGDELLGLQPTTVVQYSDSVGIFSCEEDKYQFSISCLGKSFFNYQYENGKKGVFVIVGLYEDNGQLLEKFNMWLSVGDDTQIAATWNLGSMLNPVGQKGKVKKIIKHLKSGHGYVRMVADRYRENVFDFKIQHQ